MNFLPPEQPHRHNNVSSSKYKLCSDLVSSGQTAYFSFDMGAEINKGLAYYCYMLCAENHQILVIVDRLQIGVYSLQRRSNDAYKLL